LLVTLTKLTTYPPLGAKVTFVTVKVPLDTLTDVAMAKGPAKKLVLTLVTVTSTKVGSPEVNVQVIVFVAFWTQKADDEGPVMESATAEEAAARRVKSVFANNIFFKFSCLR